MNAIIRIVEIIAACSVFFLVWNFRGVYYELKKLHDVLADWKTIAAILILILAIIVHNCLVSRQISMIVDRTLFSLDSARILPALGLLRGRRLITHRDRQLWKAEVTNTGRRRTVDGA